jgi:hypothetical protein
MSLLEQLKLSLPNFPHEVLNEWLLPFAKDKGWPPSEDNDTLPNNGWRYVLIKQPLSFWKEVKWSNEHCNFSINDFEENDKDAILQIIATAVLGAKTPLSIDMTNIKEGFDKLISYIKEHQTLPIPPVLLKTNNGYKILDGNHRIAAYFHLKGDPKLNCLTGYPKFIVSDNHNLRIQPEQTYWIAES